MSKDLNNTNKTTTIETKRLWLATVKAPQSGVHLSSCCELVNELTHSHQSMVLYSTTCHHFQDTTIGPPKKTLIYLHIKWTLHEIRQLQNNTTIIDKLSSFSDYSLVTRQIVKLHHTNIHTHKHYHVINQHQLL